MSDVSAVVLSIGETTTHRAIESVKRQTLKPEEIILIENVTPSYRAGNLGASKVKTEFLMVVGSDLVLDNDCIEIFRNCIADNVGIVEGCLRDPIMGRIVGVRMYRKICFELTKMPNSVSPDTDFKEVVTQKGWCIINALRFDEQPKNLLHTFGEHKPDYTPLYTFSKYMIHGRRYRYRRDLSGLLYRYRHLKVRLHHLSLLAEIAMGHGIFMNENMDMLKPYETNNDFEFIEKFTKTTGSYDLDKENLINLLSENPEDVFIGYFHLGIELRKAQSYSSVKDCLELLNNSDQKYAWIAKVGMCHGLFSDTYIKEKLEKDFEILKEFDFK